MTYELMDRITCREIRTAGMEEALLFHGVLVGTFPLSANCGHNRHPKSADVSVFPLYLMGHLSKMKQSERNADGPSQNKGIFVSHCGMEQSVFWRGVFHGVPIRFALVPFIMDQYYNAELMAFSADWAGSFTGKMTSKQCKMN
ncbi:hypothetical protein niasHT_025210 [Heterodera trifolii]|uniref:Uncharacterized protein n=1 Tax=Heterodera trifolii TaxID=157864 RepID=A0ABD2JLY0_9BILA